MEQAFPEELRELRNRTVENYIKQKNIELRPLRTYKTFSPFSEELVHAIQQKAEKRCVQEDTVLHFPEDDLDTIFVVQSGRVVLLHEGVVAREMENEVIGEKLLFARTCTYPYTIRADTEVVFQRLRAKNLHDVFSTYPREVEKLEALFVNLSPKQKDRQIRFRAVLDKSLGVGDTSPSKASDRLKRLNNKMKQSKSIGDSPSSKSIGESPSSKSIGEGSASEPRHDLQLAVPAPVPRRAWDDQQLVRT
jgi:CRP-like cAMP-binding protein